MRRDDSRVPPPLATSDAASGAGAQPSATSTTISSTAMVPSISWTSMETMLALAAAMAEVTPARAPGRSGSSMRRR
jgi:hypothetical protein